MSAMAELDFLLNDLHAARQAYDDATVSKHPNLGRVIDAGDDLSKAAYDLHHTLVSMLMRSSCTGR